MAPQRRRGRREGNCFRVLRAFFVTLWLKGTAEQGIIFVPFVHSLCPLWLDGTAETQRAQRGELFSCPSRIPRELVVKRYRRAGNNFRALRAFSVTFVVRWHRRDAEDAE